MFSSELEYELLHLDDEAEEAPDGNKENEDGEKEGEDGEKKKKKVVKVGVRKPLPKLDTIRLCGDEGLPKIPEHFKNFRWKGNGFELQEMDDVMQKIELWSHRLFPKLAFDDFLGRLEKLGAKREVQGMLRRMRMGTMPTPAAEDAVDDVARGDVEEHHDDFDAVMREYQETHRPVSPPSVPAIPATQPVQSTLTAEMRERIERNRRMAEERRRARAEAGASQMTQE